MHIFPQLRKLMFVDPQGRVIDKHEGELPFEQFDPLVEGMLKEFEERGILNPGAAPIDLEHHRRRGPVRVRRPGWRSRRGSPPAPPRYPRSWRRLVPGGQQQPQDQTGRATTPGGDDLAGQRGRRADGLGTSAAFREPGGVCAGANGVYIADTHNHRIAVADWATGTVRTLIGD